MKNVTLKMITPFCKAIEQIPGFSALDRFVLKHQIAITAISVCYLVAMLFAQS